MQQNLSIVTYVTVFVIVISVVFSTPMQLMRRKRGSNLRPLRRRAVEVGWSKWSRWDCPVTCGGGVAERIRTCIGPGPCEGPRKQTKKCAEIPCPSGVPQNLLDQAKSQIQRNTKSYQLQKGDEVTLECQGNLRRIISSYYRNSKVIWFHNGEIFHPIKGRIGIMDTTNLLIVKALPRDNGIWTCEVRLDGVSPLLTALYSVAVENDAPDMKIKPGEPLTLRCNSLGLLRFFKTKLITQWYQNTELHQEFPNSNLEDVQEMTIESGQPGDSGVWVCKVRESSLRSTKSWATNVMWVQVGPLSSQRKTKVEGTKKLSPDGGDEDEADGGDDGGGDEKGGSGPTIAIVFVLLAVVVGGGLYYFMSSKKRSKKGKGKDVEKGSQQKKAETKVKTGKKKDRVGTPSRKKSKEHPPGILDKPRKNKQNELKGFRMPTKDTKKSDKRKEKSTKTTEYDTDTSQTSGKSETTKSSKQKSPKPNAKKDKKPTKKGTKKTEELKTKHKEKNRPNKKR